MAKKMSVEEMLAAARAEKAGGAKPAAPVPAPSAETTGTEPMPPAAVDAAESSAEAPIESKSPPAAKPAGKVAPGGKGMP